MGSSSDGTAGAPPSPSSATTGVERPPSLDLLTEDGRLEAMLAGVRAIERAIVKAESASRIPWRDIATLHTSRRHYLADIDKLMARRAEMEMRAREVAAAEAMDRQQDDSGVVPPLAQDIAH